MSNTENEQVRQQEHEEQEEGTASESGQDEEVIDLLARLEEKKERRRQVQEAISQCLDEKYGRWDFLKESDSWAWDTCSLPKAETETLPDLVRRMMARQRLTLTDVSCRSGLDRAYIGDVLQGRVQPRRDRLIRLAFGLQLDVPEACRLLERGEAARLREDNRRDAIIALCLHWRIDLSICDSMLYEQGERTVCEMGEDRPADAVAPVLQARKPMDDETAPESGPLGESDSSSQAS